MAVSSENQLANRFRGFYPVIIDVETGGFNASTDALLEIAAVTLVMDEYGTLHPDKSIFHNVEPFAGANIEKSAIEFTGIDVDNPLRQAKPEEHALRDIFQQIRTGLKSENCQRAVLVGHNAFFDLGFVKAAVERTQIKRNPFHPFSCFDTATLSGLAFGQTVLAKAREVAGISFSNREAHSAIYDAEKTAELFCYIVNRWKDLGGWPLDI